MVRLTVNASAAARAWLRRPEVGFPLRFLLLMVVTLPVARFLSEALSPPTAIAVAWTSNLVGLPATVVEGTLVSFAGGTFVYRIIGECTAVVLGFMYAAAVLAYPTGGWARALGVLVGIPALFVLNLVRLVSLGWVGMMSPALVESLHDFWWQAFLVVFVGLGWFAWARWIAHGGGDGVRSRDLALAAVIFLGVIGAFGLIGAFARGPEIYGRVLVAVVSVVVRVLWGIDTLSGRIAPVETFSTGFLPAYSTLAAVLALFAATPRVSLVGRLRGMLLVGVPAVLLVNVVELTTMLRAVAGEVSGTLASPFLTFLNAARVGVPIAVWYAWARGRWNASFQEFRLHACPVCRKPMARVIEHVERAHAKRAHKLKRALMEAHPELRPAPPGGGSPAGADGGE